MDDYVAARESDDYLNAVGIWDALAFDVYDYIDESSCGSINKELPPIFAAFMPKSGGTFLYNRMINDFGYRNYDWGVTKELSYSEVYPTPNSVRAYKQGGVFSHTHALPTPYLRMIDSIENMGKIWVHVRNPLDASLSAYFHYNGEGQGDGLIADDRKREIKRDADKLYALNIVDCADRERLFIDTINFYDLWIRSWLDFHHENPGRIFFTKFDDLINNLFVFDKVCSSYNLNNNISICSNRLPSDRFRVNGERDWKFGLSDTAIDYGINHNNAWHDFLETIPNH